jgi:tRNA (mo5U34)-methyltransferase
MTTRSVRWRDWGVSVTVPGTVARRLKRGEGRSTRVETGGLTVLDPPPQPQVQQRDPQRAMRFVGIAAEKGDEHAVKSGFAGDDELSQRIRSISWYHTIELSSGVVTPGQFDHRSLLPHYGLPADLHGKRALDVATFDGFWAFEMEKRGGQVSAIDLDTTRDLDFPHLVRPLVDAVAEMPRIGDGFRLAHEALRSKVTRISSSVYALSPETVGSYDFVHCGDLLLHLRDPLTALQHIRSVTTGQFLLSDVFDINAARQQYGPSVQYLGGWDDVVWWVPSLDALAQMVIDAGFRTVRVQAVYQLAKTYDEAGFWRASMLAEV